MKDKWLREWGQEGGLRNDWAPEDWVGGSQGERNQLSRTVGMETQAFPPWTICSGAHFREPSKDGGLMKGGMNGS